VRTDVERWPIVGAIDEQGLVYTQDFYGIWPTGSLPIEVLAALINSPIVNAFLSTHSFSEQNLRAVLEQAPIPNFTKANIHLITSLVRDYRATRELWCKELGGMTGLGALRRIESVILGYYNLSLQTEKLYVCSFFEKDVQTTRRVKRAPNSGSGSDSCPFNSLSTFYDETAKIVGEEYHRLF